MIGMGAPFDGCNQQKSFGFSMIAWMDRFTWAGGNDEPDVTYRARANSNWK
jgi:hypothetical protein